MLSPHPHFSEPLRQDAQHLQLAPDIILYGAVMNGCEKSHQWQVALAVFQQAQLEGLAPSLVAAGVVRTSGIEVLIVPAEMGHTTGHGPLFYSFFNHFWEKVWAHNRIQPTIMSTCGCPIMGDLTRSCHCILMMVDRGLMIGGPIPPTCEPAWVSLDNKKIQKTCTFENLKSTDH